MTIARGAGIAALLAVIAVVAILLLSGGGGEQYTLIFQNAGQLVKGDDVQVGGQRVGSVDEILLTNDNQAEIKISVDEAFAPLHEGTSATIRLTSLSGVANRYIALTPGPNNAPALASGAQLGVEHTTSVVDLDQIFNTLDPKTRRGLQNVIQGSATQYAGKGPQVNESAKYFSPAISTTDQLVKELNRDQQTLTQRDRRGGERHRRDRREGAAADLAGQQPQHDDGRDREPERVALAGARRAARTRCARAARRSSTCARRSTTSTRS